MFSVLIANYNNGRYLQEAINSVFSQSLQDWEIVVVDDGSTDESHKIYERYASDSRLRIYYNEHNRGCTYTKWRLIEVCRGEVFGFLDADDVLLPDALEIMTTAHKENPNAAIVSSRHYQCDEQMNIRYESRLLHIPSGESYLTCGDFQPEAFVTFKTSFYKKTQGLNKNNPYGDDQELLLLMEEVGDWVVLDKFLYKYRIYDNSVSHGANSLICLYWNIVVYHQACIRRGLDPNKYSYKLFQDTIINSRERIIVSKPYRIGNAILHPLDFIKRHTRGPRNSLHNFVEQIRIIRFRHFPYRFNQGRFADTFLSFDSKSDDTSCFKPVEKIIYCFWTGNNEMSENRKRCLESMTQNAGVPIKLITQDNLSNYILPNHPLHPAYQYLSLNHKSDYLRGYFMHFYGGGFCDIKTIEHSWSDSFDKLNESNAYLIGYPELNGECSAYKDIENKKLSKQIKNAWPLLVGNGAFICRPQTKFTEEWFSEQNKRLDDYIDKLKEHPATDSFGQGNGYPIPWLYMQGTIFHPLCLKYHNKLLKDRSIMPLFTNYR